MLVYGDHTELTDARGHLGAVRRMLRSADQMPAGLARHARLVAALVEAGRLQQGAADGEFAAAGEDRRSPAVDSLGALVHAIAGAVCASWDGSFAVQPLPEVPDIEGLPAELALRVPEGYAFYSVYPEAYAEAARALQLRGLPRVIGIRSIGTSLAAVAAAAIGAPAPVTLRPTGDRFARSLAVSAPLEAELLGDTGAHFVIVDEGPGQSGSSFGAVADWLLERGVPEARIAFLPSHPGPPGPRASAAHRALWGRIQRQVADLGPRLPALLARWAVERLGPLEGPLADLSAGAWRPRRYRDSSKWPPAAPVWERRKYLARAGGAWWLLRFAGLGEEGERKLRLGRRLARQGLVPQPAGLLHGFLVECWHEEAEPLGEQEKPLAHLGRYLAARARLEAPDGSGASLQQLLDMSLRNVAVELGDPAAAPLETWRARLPSLERRVVRVRVDAKLDRQEWLRLPGGQLLKADAVDHHAGHDLVGRQDIAWDVAGAAVEFELSNGERARLAARVGHSAGRLVDPELVEFLTLAYLAFRLGQARLMQEMRAGDCAEVERLDRRAAGYRRRLVELLESKSNAAARVIDTAVH